MKFISKPTVVEATQWNKPGDHHAVLKTLSGYLVRGKQGLACVKEGDWIIQEPSLGDGYYPCNPEVFALKYQPLETQEGNITPEGEEIIRDLFNAGFNHAEMRA